MNLSGQGGPVNISDGANNTVALGRQSELLVTELHGRYSAQASRGNIFHSIYGNLTVQSTQVSPVAYNSAPLMALINPIGSNKNLALLRHSVATISGTPGGPFLWNGAAGQNVTVATANLNPVICGNFGIQGGNVGKVLSGGNAFSGVNASTFYPIKIATMFPAVAAAYAPQVQEEEAGALVVPPGGILALAATNTGTTHSVVISITWEEFPV